MPGIEFQVIIFCLHAYSATRYFYSFATYDSKKYLKFIGIFLVSEMKKFTALLVYAFILCHPLCAQETPIWRAKTTIDRFTKFENFTTKQGLCSNEVQVIFQDSKGYMWFGTNKGLNRFDGYSFRVFTHSSSDSLSISCNQITSIAEDKLGFLWVGTDNGLNKMDVKTGKFTRFYANKSLGSLIKCSSIAALLYTSDGFLWVDCKNNVLSKIDIENHSVRHFLRNGKSVLEGGYPFHSIIERQDKKAIIAGSVSAPPIVINKITSRSEEIKEIFDSKKELYVRGATNFTYDTKGNLWIAQIHDHMVMLDAKTGYPSNLPFKSKYALMSDGAGNIWFGGYSGGLFKYSEYSNEITRYPYNQDNPYSIAGDRINKIFRDKSGCVWVASDGGVSKYSAYANKFNHYFHIPETESLPTNKVTCMAEDADGIIWLGTQDRGLVRFERQGQQFKTIGFNRNDPNAVESAYITSIAIDKKGILWLSLWNGYVGGLNSYNPKTGKAKRYSTSVNYQWFNDVVLTSNDEPVVGSWGTGIHFFNKLTGNYKPFNSLVSSGAYSINSNTRSIVRDNENRVWLSTKGYPFYYQPYDDAFTSFIPTVLTVAVNPSLPAVLHKNSIRRVTIPSDIYLPILDVRGEPWFFSQRGTLLQYKNNDIFKVIKLGNPLVSVVAANDGGFWLCGTNTLGYFNPTTGERKSLGLNIPTGDIYTVYEENDILLVGCHSGLVRLGLSKGKRSVLSAEKLHKFPVRVFSSNSGINIYVGADNGLFRMNGKRSKVIGSGLVNAPKNVFVHAFYINKDRDFFVGTSDGLFFLPKNRDDFLHFSNYSNSETSLQSNNVFSISQDIKGLVWLGTDSYATTFDPVSHQFYTYNLPSNDALTSSLVSDLLIDSKNNLWVGTTSRGGLNCLNINTGHYDYFVPKPYNANGIKGNEINCIYEDSKNRIWVGTDFGLNLLEQNGQNFTVYDQRSGLLSADIHSIVEDKQGNLWLGTANGLTCFNPLENKYRTYVATNGLQGSDFYSRSAARLKSGELIFGGEGGFNLFNPDSLLVNKQLPTSGISGIWINGKLTFFHGKHNDTINLTYAERNISFEVTTFDFHNPQLNRFAYMLEGHDTAWSVVGASGRIIQYTNLPSGGYTFHLKSSNGDGVWSKNEVSLKVSIEYPFWQHWWFVVMVLILISGISFLINEMRERSHKRDKQLLEKTVAERTAELMAQSEEIITQRDTLQRQHNEIEHYNSQLAESLEFAKHLQDSHMQGAEELELVCGKHFLIYQPKYLVGGDFYWTANIDDNVIFCIVDCTGHGVPGALMSMVGLVTIKDIVLNQSIYDPAQVLECVHQKIVSTLIAGSPGDTVASAMDLAFCVLNRKSGKLIFSGAHCPIFIVRDGHSSFPSLQEIPGDKRLVGSPLFRSEFTNHVIDVSTDDMVYLFTDGLVDQLEEHLRRKFSRSLAREMFTSVASKSMHEQRDEILSRIMQWKGTDTQTDDITVFGIRV